MIELALFILLRDENLARRDQSDVLALRERFVVENAHQLSSSVLPVRVRLHDAGVDVLSDELDLRFLRFEDRHVVLTRLLANVETGLLQPFDWYDVALNFKG